MKNSLHTYYGGRYKPLQVDQLIKAGASDSAFQMQKASSIRSSTLANTKKILLRGFCDNIEPLGLLAGVGKHA